MLSLTNSTNPALNNNGYLKANALIKQAKQVSTLCQGMGKTVRLQETELPSQRGHPAQLFKHATIHLNIKMQL